MEDKFNLDTVDSDGLIGSEYLHLVGSDFVHTGNNKVYRVMDIVWMGEGDLWGVYHMCITPNNPYSCVRSLGNFFGPRGDVPRFKLVSRK